MTSILLTRLQTLFGCTRFYMHSFVGFFVQLYIVLAQIHIHVISTTIKKQNCSISTKEPLVLLPFIITHISYPLQSLSLETINLFLISIIFSFQEFRMLHKCSHTVGDLLRLFSFIVIHLRSIQVVCINILFLYIAEQYPMVCMVGLTAHSTAGYLGCFIWSYYK